jgi:hypothetical protein
MTATMKQQKPGALRALAIIDRSAGYQRIASMSNQEKVAAIRGLGAIKRETIGLQIARGAMLDELPGLAFAIVTLIFLLSSLSGLL